jgi:hypothetical protein
VEVPPTAGRAGTGFWGWAPVHDLLRSTTDPNILYAAVNGSGIWKTIDGGTTWNLLSGGLPITGVGRLDIGIHPALPSVLYVIVERDPTAPSSGRINPPTRRTTWTGAAIPSGSCHYWNFQDICTYYRQHRRAVLVRPHPRGPVGHFGVGRRDGDLQDDERRDGAGSTSVRSRCTPTSTR